MLLRAPLAAHPCRICDIAQGTGTFGAVDQPWLESAKFAAFVSIGALVPGWSLVAPKRHVLNLGSDYVDSEFNEFLNSAISAVEHLYGPAVLFEHGSQEPDSATSCGTAHAHLHVVPLSFSLIECSRAYDPSMEWQACHWADIGARVGRDEYLFVADSVATGTGHLAILKEGVSQFFRRVIAKELGRPDEFNYRTHPQTEIAEASANALRAAQALWAKAA